MKRAADQDAEPMSKRPRTDLRDSVDTVGNANLVDPTTDAALQIPEGEIPVKIRVLMGREFVGGVIGKGGSTIKAIMAKSNAKVQVAGEEEMPGAPHRLIRIEGTLRTVSFAQQLISEIITPEGTEEDKCELLLLIPNSAGGIIIGKGGDIVQDMIAKSGAHISLSAQGINDRVVTVTGPKEGLARAQVLIAQRIEEGRAEQPGRYDVVETPRGGPPMGGMAGGGMAMGMYGGGAAFDGPSMTATLTVRNNDAGSIIGHAGSVIRQLQEATGTRIHLSDNEPGAETRQVKITGPAGGVTHCQQLIQAAIAQGAARAPPLNTGDGPVVTSTMQVTNVEASSIIGHGGSVVRNIQSQSGARVHISDHEQGSEYRVLTVSGAQSAVDVAERLVQQALADSANAPAGGGASAAAAAGGAPALEFPLTATQVGAVIGRGGENIKAIQSTTGARLKISDFDASNPTRTLSITGGQAAVASASAMVEQILRDPTSAFSGAQTFTTAGLRQQPAAMAYGGMAPQQSYGSTYPQASSYGAVAPAAQNPYGAPAYGQGQSLYAAAPAAGAYQQQASQYGQYQFQ